MAKPALTFAGKSIPSATSARRIASGVAPSRRSAFTSGAWDASQSSMSLQICRMSDIRPSAFDDVDGEAAAGGLLVLDRHVRAGVLHRLDDLVQGHVMRAVAAQRHPKPMN